MRGRPDHPGEPSDDQIRLVYAFLRPAVGSAAEAEAATLEVLTRAMACAGGGTDGGPDRAELLALARSALVEREPGARRARLRGLLGTASGSPPDRGGCGDGLPDPDLWAALERLPERQAEALRLRHAGLGPHELGEVVSQSETEVERLYRRALAALAAQLSAEAAGAIPEAVLERRLEAAVAGLRPRPELAVALRAGRSGRGGRRRGQSGATDRAAREGVESRLSRRAGALLALAVALMVALAALAVVPRFSPRPATGRLPAARLAPPEEDEAGPAGVPAPPGVTVPYFGPARLAVTAVPPPVPAELPVLRWTEPAPARLAAAGRELGGFAYPGPQVDREPLLIIDADRLPGGPAPAPAAARRAADEFLTAHGLAPRWPDTVVVTSPGTLDVVGYIRQFEVGRTVAEQVDRTGEPVGAEVVVGAGSTIVQVTLPLPLTLERGQRPARDAARAQRDAVSQPPAAARGLIPVPEVDLDHVGLVYVAMSDGGQGFYEPGYLFTGTFVAGGTTYQKRVLVPALASSQLG